MIRVLLADDQPLIRGGFRALLDAEDDIAVVGEAADGHAAVALAAEHVPDVALMDVQMPILDGIEATRRIAADPRLAGVHVVILTNYGFDEHIYNALRAGASGFLVKDIEPADLLHASGSPPEATLCWRRRSPAGSSASTCPGHPTARPPTPSRSSPTASARSWPSSPAG